MGKQLYEPFVSSFENKKYGIFVMNDGNKRLIYFGYSRYQPYRDIL